MKKDKVSLTPEMTNDEVAAVINELKSISIEGRILEIGTSAGGMLVEMMKAVHSDWHSRFTVVDIFEYFPNHLGVFRDNLKRNGLDPDKIFVCVGNSSHHFRQACNRGDRYSFMLLDTSHKLKHTMQDLRWTSLLNLGGTVALHDYGHPNFPGVEIAVKRFLKNNPNYKVKSLTNRLLIIEKTAISNREEVGLVDLAFAYAYSVVLQNSNGFNRMVGRVRKQ
jgi:predicted O-methyltransferase YrrM